MGVENPRGSAGSGVATINAALGSYATWVDALQAAVDTITANPAVSAIVQLPAGTITLDKAGVTGIVVPLNFAGKLVFRGAGRGATTVHLSANTPSFLVHTPVTPGDTIQNVTVEDLTVDANNISAGGAGTGIVTQFGGLGLNGKNITVRRVSVINAGVLTSTGGGIGRRCIAMVSNGPWPQDATTRTWTDILVEDCDLGIIGGGSNTGVHISVGVQGGARTTLDRFINTGSGMANYFFDRITVRNVRWDSGQTGIPGATITSAGVQVGGHGRCGQVTVENCWVKGAGDVGYEFDSVLDLNVRGCYSENSYNASFFLANNHGGLNIPEQHSARLTDCTAKCSQNLVSFVGFAGYALQSSEFGHIRLRGCSVVRTHANYGPGAIPSAPGFYYTGPIRSITMRDCSYTHKGQAIDRSGLASGAAYTLQPSIVRLYPVGNSARILIDGFDYEADGTLDQGAGTGVLTHNVQVIDINSATKVTGEIRNVRSRGAGWTLTGAVTPVVRLREVQLPGGASIPDDFTGSTFLSDVYADAGSLADLSQDTGAGTLSSVANHATRRLLRWLATSTNFTSSQRTIMRAQDAAMLVTGTTPSDLSAGGYELGAYLKGSDDGQSRLEGRLTDDGAASTLEIRKVVAGTPTVLATQSIARLTAATGYGVRLIQRGNVLTLDFFASNATQSLGTAGTTTVTATLAGSDTSDFGADSGTGWVGLLWAPLTADATLKLVRHDRLSVVGLLLSRIIPAAVGKPMTAWSGLRVLNDTDQMRIMGTLVLRDCDFSNRRGHGTVKDIENVTGQKPFIVTEKHVYAAPPTMNGTIAAPGSGVAYTNTDGFIEDVFIYGGTLTTPFLEVSRDQGASFAQVLGANGPAVVRLGPGDQLRTTYSAAPTFRKVPVL